MAEGFIVAVKSRNKSGNTSFQNVDRVEEGPHCVRIYMLDGTEQMYRWDYIDWVAVVPTEIYAARALEYAEAQAGKGKKLVTPTGAEIDDIIDETVN